MLHTIPSLPPLFELGQTFITPGALELAEQGVDMRILLNRHQTGDWSEMDDEDQQENLSSVDKFLRIVSGYNTEYGQLMVITEADRSVTTVLLPEEY